MTQEVTRNWHRTPATVAEEMTVRFGAHYVELCEWAAERGLEFPLEINYHILGLDDFTNGTANLALELNYPESQTITEEWEQNPIVQELKRFAELFASDERISKKYPGFGHSGSIRKTRRNFRNIQTHTFLLLMITNPLAPSPDHLTFKNRRRLRIWLIIQAANRLIDFGYAADTSISSASRFLQIDTADEHWQLIDELLDKAQKQIDLSSNSFEHFTSAIENAASLLNGTARHSKTVREFLNSISAIAGGSCSEIEPRSTNVRIPPHFKRAPSPTDEMLFEVEDTNFNVVVSPSDEYENVEFAYLTEVDTTDSNAQQTLSSGSVFIQTSELSHYLPWSWDRLLPPEEQLVWKWVKNKLHATTIEEKLGGTLVWLAIQLSRSLSLVERIVITPETSAEWSLSPDFELLKRSAPRRHSGWRPQELQLDQVTPFHDELVFSVPKTINHALKGATTSPAPTPQTLGALWRDVSNITLDAWFNKQAKGHFPRVTSAKLAQCRSQKLFNLTGDFSFTRLLTSHPQSAIPGACSYATWDVKAIEKGLQAPVFRYSNDPDNVNLMGSLLAPIESILHQEIDHASKLLAKASHDGLIHYHNALTQYVVMALYAATGARPLRDPFESARHFSLTFSCVYINDKSDGSLRNGRLVPLPNKMTELLSLYLRHLGRFSEQIRDHRNELAQQISTMAKGHFAKLPFFFLIDEYLCWHSMADAAELNCQLFEWTLPDNLFRHRYSQRLLKEGVDPEVIEGWMGHAERGSASYSDYSARCWADDVNTYRKAFERAFNALPFFLPAEHHELPPLLFLASLKTTYIEPRLFGQRVRARQRKLKLNTAIQETRSDIQFFLNGRQLNDLSDENLLSLSRRMLLRENRLPHPQAALRFRVFSKLIKRSSTKDHQKFPQGNSEGVSEKPTTGSARRDILKKRLVQLSEERSLIHTDITAALELYPLLSTWVVTIKSSTIKASLSKSRALSLGAALLAVEKRLGYKRLLLDVMEGKHFRLLQNERQYFFEYSEALNPGDFSTAVQRHEISYKVASLLAHGLKSKKAVKMPSPIDMSEFETCLEIYHSQFSNNPTPSMADLLSWLCHVINQANLIQLPGIVAAALSERSPPTSASLRDYIRILHGPAIEVPGDIPHNTVLPSQGLARRRVQEADKLQLQENAKEFTRTISNALDNYTPPKALHCAEQLQAVCKAFQSSISSSLMLAGLWIANQTQLGKRPKRKKRVPFAKSSLTTYWSSISPGFREFLYDVDLLNLDSDEITDACSDMIEYKLMTSKHTDYFGKRLKEFFRWASLYGVASPEWDELNINSGYRTVSAGLITEEEYQTCHSVIQADSSLSLSDKTTLGFVLLLTYRYGLRAKEAINILRRDWCQDDQHCWVLVQNNQYRQLKSTASRRAVPLLFNLSKLEENIIDRALSHYKSIATPETNRPILCETSKDSIPILTNLAPRISEALIQVLRSVTGNPNLVLHHCRHSFYNRVAPALFDLQSPLAAKLSGALGHPEIKRTVLGGTNTVSRRSAMALARLMGHRFPSTGLKNYCHLITDWIDTLIPVDHPRARKISGITQISELSELPKISHTKLSPSLEYPAPSLSSLLKTLRLVGLGLSYERAGDLTEINPSHLSLLKKTLDITTARMRFSSPNDKNIKLKGSDHPEALLTTVSDNAWHRLIHRSDTLGDTKEPILNAGSIKHLGDLPYLTGTNRHLLMEQPSHALLVAQTIRIFEIPSTQFQVIDKDSRHKTHEKMMQAGFDVMSESAIRTKLDTLRIYQPDREGAPRSENYSALILSRSKDGIVRNSFELVVAFLATGVLAQIEHSMGKSVAD